MAISISAIKTAYDALGTLYAISVTKRAALATARTSKPAYPDIADTDASYNDVTTAILAWEATLDTKTSEFNTAITNQKAQELVVYNLLPDDQWVELTSLANWGAATGQWIGKPLPAADVTNAYKLYTIYAVIVEPTNPFPAI